MAFPYSARYFIRFRHSDSGLTPSFTYFKDAGTLAAVTPPTIYEVGGGTYYFDWLFETQDDSDIVFEVDGGSSIPTEEVRYVSDTISPRDHYLDRPISQVSEDVWSDEIDYAGWGEGTTKGEFVNYIGLPTNAFDAPTVFGRIQKAAVIDIMGGTPGDGSFLDPAGNSVRDVYLRFDTVDAILGGFEAPDNASIAAIKAKTDQLPSDLGSFLTRISAQLARALGMLHENSVLDKIVYDGTTNNLKTARLRTYSNAEAANSAKAAGDNVEYTTDLVGQYSVVCEYSGDNMTSYMLIKEFPLS